MRAELRSLTPEHAEVVGAHLLMAGQLIDTDPQLAYAHAEAARRRAARLPVTREAAGETAYAAGHFDVALNEFRALRRMSGTTEYLAAMADCERALGRPQAALRLVKEGLAANPDIHQLVELRLVEAGVRVDAGQAAEALRLLRAEIERIGSRGPKLARARLRFGYADLLEASGDADLAERWFASAAALDVDNETDAAERAAALEGVTIIFDEDEAADVEGVAAADEPVFDDAASEAEPADVAAPELPVEPEPEADLPPASDGAPDGLPEEGDD